jgi:hypothetical protein
MKTFLTPKVLIAVTSLAIVLPSLCQADPAPPEEFAGIKWASSEEAAKAVMNSKTAKLNARYTKDSHLAYNGGSVAGLDVFAWDLYFAADKFCRGQAQFKDNWDNDGLFKQLKKLLTEKYGTRKSETFKPAAEPSAEWRLVAPAASDGIVIRLWIGGNRANRRVRLEYTNEAFAKLAPPERLEPEVKGDGL